MLFSVQLSIEVFFLCMFLFALLGKFAVRVLINKCSPLTYIIFWLFSCACFNWHRAYRSFDGLVLLARQQQQQQHRCFLESILIVVAELSLMSNSISLYQAILCKQVVWLVVCSLSQMDICAILQQVGFLTAEIRVFMTWFAPNIFPSKNGMQLCISNTVLAVYFENSRLY